MVPFVTDDEVGMRAMKTPCQTFLGVLVLTAGVALAAGCAGSSSTSSGGGKSASVISSPSGPMTCIGRVILRCSVIYAVNRVWKRFVRDQGAGTLNGPT